MVAHTIATCQLEIIWNLIQEHSEDNYKFTSAEKRAINPSKQRAGGRVLWISSDRDDQRIFLFCNFRFLDLSGEENFGKYSLGSLI